ncbi:MAG: uroporphyrinogen decarboxylase family protein [Armatimonadota bacterium]|nr:uroporphyrinogen decarboxylase family protein [Armatimonadota bacterium]
MKMDSRERVFRALNFEQPDRVPIDFWMSSGFKKKILSYLRIDEKAFLDSYNIDLRYIEGPRYIGPPLRTFSDGTDEDIWGVRRSTVTVPTPGGQETYKEVAWSPLAFANSVEDVYAYDHWPSPDWFDYSKIEKQCDEIRNEGRVVVFMGDRMNRLAQLKPAMYLRGVEEIFIDMGVSPEIAEAIFARICDFYCEYAERIFEAAKGKIDILLMGDDFGSQNGPLVSPEMWAQFLGKGFSKYISLAKAYGLRVIHHTCGSVRQIIPLMIERGLDVLQSLQPEAADMDPRTLKSEFGNQLAFHGGISVQRTLPFGTPGDVRREVKDRIEALAPGGGYILCTAHNIQADTPVENVLALLHAYMEYGRY